MMRVSAVSFFVLGLFITLLTGCGGGDDGPSGATASLSWDAAVDESLVSYTVHYGRQSTGGDGSCNYENSIDVSEPFAFISGLEFSTRYYFAVSAHNENGRSRCSNEVSKVTPEKPPLRIGDAGKKGFNITSTDRLRPAGSLDRSIM